MSRCLLSTTTTYRLVRPEAQIWAPAPRRRWPRSVGRPPLGQPCSRPAAARQCGGTNAPAVIQRGDGRQGAARPCRGATTEGVQARKSMSVAYLREYKKAYSSFRSTGRGNGATGVHRAFSDEYQGASIEHSLMDTRVGPIEHSQMDPTKGSRSTKCTPRQYVRQETHMLALRV